jgi:hypothetical protein
LQVEDVRPTPLQRQHPGRMLDDLDGDAQARTAEDARGDWVEGSLRS